MAQYVFTMNRVSKTVPPKRQILKDISLSFFPGAKIGMLGINGSGKSSLGDVLLGLLTADAGEVTRLPQANPVRYQKLYQDPPSAFPQKITLGEAIADLVRLHRLDGNRVQPLMDRLRLSRALLTRQPTEVSGGELQRFALLRVLLLDPVFLFADEPTSRLDLITQQETIDLLTDLARERNCAVLLVSHDAALVEKTCDRQVRIGSTELAAAG